MTLLRLVLVSRSADGHGPERDAGRAEPHLQHGQHQQTAHDLPAAAHPRSGILPAAPEQCGPLRAWPTLIHTSSHSYSLL